MLRQITILLDHCQRLFDGAGLFFELEFSLFVASLAPYSPTSSQTKRQNEPWHQKRQE